MEIPWEEVIACVIPLGLFAIVFGFVAFTRWLKYKETLALAEKGLVASDVMRRDEKRTLRWGIITTALGLAFLIGLFSLGFGMVDVTFPPYFGPWLLPGLLVLFLGIGLIIVYYATKEEVKEEKEEREC
jgi:heme O synthase-like polyprenyltransferase